jgi:hypothetical protein
LQTKAGAVQKFKEDDFHHMPYSDTLANATGVCLCPPAARHVHLQDRLALIIGKYRSYTRYFMHVLQNVRHGFYRQCSTLPRTDYQCAPFVGAAEDNQGGSVYGVVRGEHFDGLMHYISILDSDNKYAALLRL